MQVRHEQYDVGVIVGRFQVPDLHDAHEQLIRHVCEAHDKVVIFLGLSPLLVTRENPLDFQARKQMILEKFPDVIVLYIEDRHSDELWSRRLDQAIATQVTPAQSVVLYGGRDSFIAKYDGKYPTAELEQETYVSGSELRRSVARKSAEPTSDFRAGVVWAAYSRFPTVYTCVDVAVFNESYDKILLARKEDETQYRLIGGFSSPDSETFEDDARREVSEEAHIEIGDVKSLASFKIDDWRYRSEADKIKTILFSAKHLFGAPRPDDDIVEVRWFDLDELKIKRDVMPNHQPLVAAATNPATNPKIDTWQEKARLAHEAEYGMK
jgi:bifunctional NMN adenylyltransferase/nudix hydrolase